MGKYPSIQTIRYMGNKAKLLDSVIPEIEALTNPGDAVCDIMAGTNAVGYALKKRNVIIANDIQNYSYIISKTLLNNYQIPTVEKAHADLDEFYFENKKAKKFSFFIDNYVDTYFTFEQCLDIDSFRYAIEKINDDNEKSFYLTLLMNAMCKAQSTTGHFAQFLDKNNKRVKDLRKKSVYQLFFEKIADFDGFIISDYENACFNNDYKEIFDNPIIDNVKCFYLDSPYTSDQYSRFYHLLETVCKYDKPELEFKAKYRTDRFMSDFCYKKSVASEFKKIIGLCKLKKASMVISYSNHGVLPVQNLVDICKCYYANVEVKYVDFEHSSQGSGTIDIKEVIIILK